MGERKSSLKTHLKTAPSSRAHDFYFYRRLPFRMIRLENMVRFSWSSNDTIVGAWCCLVFACLVNFAYNPENRFFPSPQCVYFPVGFCILVAFCCLFVSPISLFFMCSNRRHSVEVFLFYSSVSWRVGFSLVFNVLLIYRITSTIQVLRSWIVCSTITRICSRTYLNLYDAFILSCVILISTGQWTMHF